MSLTEKDKRNVLIVFLVFCAMFLVLFGPRINSDGANYIEFLHSIIHDGDLNFADERAFFTPRYVPVFPFYGSEHNQTGYPSNLFTIGPALFWLPGQAFSEVIHSLIDREAMKAGVFDYDVASRFMPAFLSCLAVLAGLLLTYRALRYLFDETSCLIVVLLLLLTTHLPAFAFVTPAFSHGPAFFFSSLFILSWVMLVMEDHSGRFPWNLFLILGACLGMLTSLRLQGAFFAVIPAVHWLSILIRPVGNDRPLSAAALTAGYSLSAVAAVVFMVPQMVSQLTLFGNLLADPQGAGGMHWTSLSFGLVLFHKTRGLFIVNPVLLPACLGMFLLWRRQRLMTFVLLIGLAVQFYINMVRRDWCGVGFGMRRFIESLPLLAFGFAALISPLVHAFRTMKPVRILGIIMLACMTCWNILLMGQYYFGRYGDPAETLRMSFSELMAGQVTRAPRLILGFIDGGYPFPAAVRLLAEGAFRDSLLIFVVVGFSGVAMMGIARLSSSINLRSRSVTVGILLSAVLVLWLSIALNGVRHTSRSLFPVNLSLIHENGVTVKKRDVARLSLAPDVPYRGSLDSLIFSSSGTFQQTCTWSYERGYFLSNGRLEKRRQFLCGPSDPLRIVLSSAQAIDALHLVIRFDGGPRGDSGESPLELLMTLLSSEGTEHSVTIAPEGMSSFREIAIPDNWRIPDHPEAEGSFILAESRLPPLSHAGRLSLDTMKAQITEIRILKRGRGTVTLNGLAFSSAEPQPDDLK